MHLLIDIGNSTVVAVISDSEGQMRETWRFKTLKDQRESYFRNELLAGLGKCRVSLAELDAVIVSSVVPEVNDDIALAITGLTGMTPHFFSISDARRILDIDVESPSQIGNDRLADAIGAVCCYGAPVIVFDMGTATTVGVIDGRRTFIGGMIIPGVKTSLNALSKRASQLPVINIVVPQHVIGRNTIESMQSGIIHGTAAMIDGIIDRIAETLDAPATIVATGGMAKTIVPHCRHDIIRDDFLQFKGILHVASVGH